MATLRSQKKILGSIMFEQVHCVHCSSVQQIVEVHGHRQCLNCGINVEPCCEGSALPEYEENPSHIDITSKDR